MQACSDLAGVVLVLVRRVTVVIVHIGPDEVVVVIHFCVATLFVNCCIRRYSPLQEVRNGAVEKSYTNKMVHDLVQPYPRRNSA